MGGDSLGDDRHQQQVYNELTHELLAAFDGVLVPPEERRPTDFFRGGGVGKGSAADGGSSGSQRPGTGGEADKSMVSCGTSKLPHFHLRRATCEVFRRRTPPLASRAGDRHVDIRRLSLPEP